MRCRAPRALSARARVPSEPAFAAQLSATTVERVTKQLRKLPWKEPDIQRWCACSAHLVCGSARGTGYTALRRFVQTMLECAEVKYHTIQLVACVASGLVKAQEATIVRFVDSAGARTPLLLRCQPLLQRPLPPSSRALALRHRPQRLPRGAE